MVLKITCKVWRPEICPLYYTEGGTRVGSLSYTLHKKYSSSCKRSQYYLGILSGAYLMDIECIWQILHGPRAVGRGPRGSIHLMQLTGFVYPILGLVLSVS